MNPIINFITNKNNTRNTFCIIKKKLHFMIIAILKKYISLLKKIEIPFKKNVCTLIDYIQIRYMNKIKIKNNGI